MDKPRDPGIDRTGDGPNAVVHQLLCRAGEEPHHGVQFDQFGASAGCQSPVELGFQLLLSIEAAADLPLGGENGQQLGRLGQMVKGNQFPRGGARR